MSDNSISILDGSTFLVSSPNGDIDARPDEPQGPTPHNPVGNPCPI